MMSLLPLREASTPRRKRSRTDHLANFPRVHRVCLCAMTAAWALGCAAPAARFPTLEQPPPPASKPASDPVDVPPPTLLAQAQHLRQDAVGDLLLALSLGDEDALARLLGPDGQLTREQQSVPLTAHALLTELEATSKSRGTLVPSGPGVVLSGRVVDAEGTDGLIVEVEGESTVRGRWTVVFYRSPVGLIKELRLPPRTT